MASRSTISRREFLRMAGIGTLGIVAAACTPAATPEPTKAPTKAAAATNAPAATAAPTKAAATAAPKAPVTISYWHIWGGARTAQLQTVLDDFTKANPEIKVEPLMLPNPGYADKIIPALAGDAPDCTMIYTDEFAPSAKRNALRPLDEMMAKDGISKDIWYPGMLAMGQWGGKVCGLPAVGNFLAMLYWNKTEVKDAGLDPEKGPATWEELLAVAKKMTVTNADGSIKRLGYQPMGSGDWIDAVYRNGGTFLGDGTAEKVAINTPESLDALKFAAQTYDVQGGYDKVGAAMTGFGNQQITNTLIAGVASVLRSNVFTVNVINQTKPDLPYMIGKVPKGPKGEFLDLTTGSWNNSLPARGKNTEAAWTLAKYLSAGDGHEKFMVELQARPAMVKKYNEAPYDAAARKGNPYWDIVLEILNGKQASYPVSDKLVPITKLINEAFESVMLKKRTAEEGVKWAQDEIVKAIKAE